MNKAVFFLLAVLSFLSCNILTEKNEATGPDEKSRMLETDKAFSKMSMEKGMKSAFLEYIDSNGVLLKPNEFPIIGADAVDYLIQQNDSAYTLQWEPKGGAVAKSGDLGYTFGLYALKAGDSTKYGTYVSIWKRQSDGSWKFVLDSGNEGVGRAEE